MDIKKISIGIDSILDIETQEPRQDFICPVPLEKILAIYFCIQRGNAHDENFQYEYIVLDERYTVPEYELRPHAYCDPALVIRLYTEDAQKRLEYIRNAAAGIVKDHGLDSITLYVMA